MYQLASSQAGSENKAQQMICDQFGAHCLEAAAKTNSGLPIALAAVGGVLFLSGVILHAGARNRDANAGNGIPYRAPRGGSEQQPRSSARELLYDTRSWTDDQFTRMTTELSKRDIGWNIESDDLVVDKVHESGVDSLIATIIG